MNRAALGDRAVLAAKCSVAAAGAWLLALVVLPSEAPYYAPMTAFLMMHPTIATSLRGSVQYLAAACLGTTVALALTAVLDTGAVGIAATVGLAVLVGGLPQLDAERATVGFWALFVLVVGGDEPIAYVLTRLPEAALGVVVGLLINLTLVPPVRVRPAEQRLAGLRTDLADLLAAMAEDLRHGWPPERPRWGGPELRTVTTAARAAVQQAQDSLRWNPRHRGWQQATQRQVEAMELLEQIGLGVRALAGLLLDAAQQETTGLSLPGEVRALLADHLAATADQVRGSGEAPAPGELRQRIAALHHDDPASWLAEGTVVVQLERLSRQAAALGALSP